MTKEEARKYYKTKRLEFSETQVQEFSKEIFQLWKSSKFSSFNNYHSFIPIKNMNEVNTFPIINYLWQKDKKVFCPKVKGDELEHFELKSDTILDKNNWGILETKNEIFLNKNKLNIINCVFVPLLICDKSGNRVGYGKGFYDKFLSKTPNAIKIGLSFFDPIENIENINSQDIQLDYLITQKKCIDFHNINQ